MNKTESTEQLLRRAFARLDAVAFGVAVGALCGVGLCAATMILALKGGDDVGHYLRLLWQYFPGYHVTLPGAFIGLGYGFLAGFVAGWLLAFVRNAALWIYLLTVKMRAASASFRGFFDNM